MSTTQEQYRVESEDALPLSEIPLAELSIAIWESRRWLAKVALIGLLVAVGIALLIPNEYTSTAHLMPPDAAAFSSASALSPLSLLGGGGLLSSGLAGGLLDQPTPGATAIGILTSRVALDDIINRFDLRKVYRCKLDLDARKKLLANTSFAEDKKDGIITIAVTDRDKYRARAIAQAYIEELNQLVNSLSTSSARRERVFLEQRLTSIKANLDTSSQELSKFSSKNATFDPGKQGEATVEAATKLQGELITAESQLSGLEAIYSDDNMRVRAAHARVEELQSQLQKMGGVGQPENSAGSVDGQFLPSVRELPLLGVTYYNLYRQVEMYEAVYETLYKQYELAKVEEAKEIPLIKVLDVPDLPERKSSPHRLIIAAMGLFASLLVGIVWIVSGELWKRLDDSHPGKLFASAISSFRNKHGAPTPG